MAVKKHNLADILLYKWRYPLGYTLLAVLYITAITVAAIYIPGGLTQSEIDFVNLTNQLSSANLSSFAIPDLPLHLLQVLSFHLFGVSILSIKLPAIILSVISAIAIFFILKRWFKSSIAILSLIIMTTSAQLILIGQSATTEILQLTYTSLFLLCATLIIQKARFAHIWRIILALTIGLSLFTPYFWYINLGMLLVALLHPHPRHFLLSKKHRLKWLPALAIFTIIFAIIFYFASISSTFLRDISGIATINFDLLANLKSLFYLYLSPTPVPIHGQLAPVINFGTLILVIFGLLKSSQQLHSARTFMTWSWLALSMALLIIDPKMISIITIPLFILLAIGLEALFYEWYKLFPRNPYARGTGLLLIIILIGTITIGGISRYMSGYRYTPEVVNQFSTDIAIFRVSATGQSTTLLATDSEKAVYEALSRHEKQRSITVVTEIPDNFSGELYVTHAARSNLPANITAPLTKIITNDRAEAGDRFYVYTLPNK